MNRIIKSPKKSRRRSSSKKKPIKNSSPKKHIIKKSRRRSSSKKQSAKNYSPKKYLIKKSRRRSRHKGRFDSFGNIVGGVGAVIDEPELVAEEPAVEEQTIESVVGAAAFDRWVYDILYNNNYIPVEPEKNIWRKTNFFPVTHYMVNDSFRNYLVNNNEYEIIDNNNFRQIETGHVVDIRNKHNIKVFLDNFANNII